MPARRPKAICLVRSPLSVPKQISGAPRHCQGNEPRTADPSLEPANVATAGSKGTLETRTRPPSLAAIRRPAGGKEAPSGRHRLGSRTAQHRPTPVSDLLRWVRVHGRRPLTRSQPSTAGSCLLQRLRGFQPDCASFHNYYAFLHVLVRPNPDPEGPSCQMLPPSASIPVSHKHLAAVPTIERTPPRTPVTSPAFP
jgi:hypothetical protein